MMSEHLPLPTPEEFEALIEPACEAFEAAWKTYIEKLTGSPPEVMDCHKADEDSPANRYLFRELQKLDQKYREKLAARLRNGKATLPMQPALRTGLDPERTRTEPGPAGAAALPTIPGYEVLEELGHGGMGVVYKARDLGLNRLVALKMIRAGDFADEDARRRFQREAEAVARLKHPDIVQIYEIGKQEGQPFFSLEFVEGGSLASRLDGTPWLAARAARLVEVVARAVQAAHEAHLVHRDLTPGNVLLTADGTPKVTDFGLVKQLDPAGQQSQSGVIAGTPSYMSPEQAGSKSKEVGPATDVYALGAILYELLTGRPPFRGETPTETVLQVISQEPVPPSWLNSKVPRDLETICLKCLEKDPATRYGSAEDLAEDLRRFLVSEPIHARPAGPWGRTVKWARRRPALAALYFAMAAVTGVSILYAIREAEHARQIGKKKEELDGALSKSKDYLRRSARFALNQGLTHCEHGEVSRGMHALAQSVTMAEQAGASDVEDEARRQLALWQTQLHSLSHEMQNGPDEAAIVAFRPDGKTFLTARGNEVHLRETASGKTVARLRHKNPVLTATFAPDGKTVLTGCWDIAAQMWDATTGQPRGAPFRHKGGVHQVAFSNDGKSVLTGSYDGRVLLWDATTCALKNELALDSFKDPFKLSAVALSPDGKKALLGSEKGTICLWYTALNENLKIMLSKGHHGRVYAVAFSPDGRRFVTAGWDHIAWLWDAPTKDPERLQGPNGRVVWAIPGFEPREPLVHQERVVETVAFTHDGKTLVTAGGGVPNQVGEVRLWDAETGQQIGDMLPHETTVRKVAFTPNGRTLLTACGNGKTLFWNVAPGPSSVVRFRHQESVSHAKHHPTGKTMITRSQRKVLVWDVSAGKVIRELPAHTNAVGDLALSQDGKLVLSAGLKEACLLELPNLTCVCRFSFPELVSPSGSVPAVALSRDGQTIVIATDDDAGLDEKKEKGTVWIFTKTSASGEPLKYRRKALTYQGIVADLALSRDSKTLLTGSCDKTARLWDLSSDQCIHTLNHPGPVTAVAFSPDDKVFATGTDDGIIRLWDATAGRPIVALKHHSSAIRKIAFSPDGKIVASGSKDTTARLWEASTARPFGPPLRHAGGVSDISFTPDGKKLVTAGADENVRLWPIPAPKGGTAKQLELWVQMVTRMELDERGNARPLDDQAVEDRRKRLHDAGGSPSP
jgi:WD40 repeat protein